MKKSNNFKTFHQLLLLPFFVAMLTLSGCDGGGRPGPSPYPDTTTESDSKESQLRNIVNNLNVNGYTYQLKAYATELAEEWYGGGGPTGWMVKDSYILGEVKSDVLSDQHAKRISCTVHVSMEGAMGLGLRSGSVDIWVEGTLTVKDFDGENYNVDFNRGDYRKINVGGGLQRRD